MKNESFLQKQNRKKENIYGRTEMKENKWKFPQKNMASKCKSDFEKLSSHVRIFFQIANFFQ